MDVYQIITNRILELLEQGTIPWRKAWSAGTAMPRNLISNKEYRGINVFLLTAMPYSSPYWLTYKQATDLGGHVNAGEKSSMVVFWKLLDRQEEETTQKIPILRYYNLFNLEQCSDIETPPLPDEVINPFSPIDQAEQLVTSYTNHPFIQHGGNRAYYRPCEDLVQMPHQHTFNSPEDYYAVLFHELAHSTGAQHRLCRKEVIEHNQFGSAEYSAEELVAECTAAFLCCQVGISNQTIEQSAAYIDGWLSVLRKDKRLLVLAAAQAQKAADYILNKSSDQSFQ